MSAEVIRYGDLGVVMYEVRIECPADATAEEIGAAGYKALRAAVDGAEVAKP